MEMRGGERKNESKKVDKVKMLLKKVFLLQVTTYNVFIVMISKSWQEWSRSVRTGKQLVRNFFTFFSFSLDATILHR